MIWLKLQQLVKLIKKCENSQKPVMNLIKNYQVNLSQQYYRRNQMLKKAIILYLHIVFIATQSQSQSPLIAQFPQLSTLREWTPTTTSKSSRTTITSTNSSTGTQSSTTFTSSSFSSVSSSDSGQTSRQIDRLRKRAVQNVKIYLMQGETDKVEVEVRGFLANEIVTCEVKIQFIDQVTSALGSKKTQTQYLISKKNTQIQALKNEQGNYTQQKTLLQNLKKQINVINYNTQLSLNQDYYNLLKDNITRFQSAANLALNKLKELPQNNIEYDISKDIAALNQLQIEMNGTTDAINKSIKNKQRIDQNIIEIKISKLYDQVYSKRNNIIESKSRIDLDKFQKLYSQASLKQKQKQMQLKNLQQELKRKQNTPTIYDQEIQATEKELANLRVKISDIRTQLVEANQVLTKQAEFIKDRIKNLNIQCPF